MAAEHGELGYWSYAAMQAEKKKRKEAFDAACGNMNLNLSHDDEIPAADLLESDARTPLAGGHLSLSHSMATDILKEIKKLQTVNPANTKFLTEVLETTTDYIRNPNDATILRNYNEMTQKVATKYGRHAALTGLLLGLPASMVIGGMIGATFMCAAFPGFIPLIAAVSIIVILAATIASSYPANKVGKIAMGWDDLKKEMNTASPRPSFK